MIAVDLLSISVLLPSRGRPTALMETMAGLLALAADPDDMQIWIAADPDDDATQALAGSLYAHRACMWTPPERYGYKNLHRYVNKLAEMACGEWLMFWNDDATMLTSGWDDVIRREAPGILWPQADYAPAINTFPVIPRAWARHLGHVSLDQSADMWWYELGLRTETQRKIPVSIHHAHMCGDATANERDAVANVATFHAPAMVAAREADAAKLRELLVP